MQWKKNGIIKENQETADILSDGYDCKVMKFILDE